MPSTYSSSFRLELPATGEKSGLWGSITDANLGTVLEEAITGVVSVSVTAANQALTTTQTSPPTTEEARHAVLDVDTTTGANFAIYSPPAPKVYIIRNSSSYTCTVYNSTVLGNTTAAGAGASVAAGKTAIVQSDGTDFVTINALTDLEGTLTVANGGTGRTTSTTAYGLIAAGTTATGALQTVSAGGTDAILVGGGASALPVWTTATGSGAPVRATSPTLVTPALGTPASGVLTNCTGTAAGLTAGNVTTNANLTGPITSTGNATAVAAQTGTGSTFVMQASPTLTTPNIGTPSAGVLTNCTGTAAGLTAGNVTTNANLTGPITSVGNATSVAAQTGTGSTFVMQASPTLTTPNIGTPSAGTLTNCTSLPIVAGTTGTLSVARGGTGIATATAYSVICAGTAATGPFQNTGPGTSGYVLTSNGASALPTFQALPSEFASGTRLFFQQTSAPTGWTKDTTSTYNESAMRIVTGTAATGGADNFTTLFGTSKTTASHTLTTTEIPSHTHSGTTGAGSSHSHGVGTYSAASGGVDHTHSYTSPYGAAGGYSFSGASTTPSAQNTGTASAYLHTHSITGSSAAEASHTHSFTTGGAGSDGSHSHTLSNMNLKYTDGIIATKN